MFLKKSESCAADYFYTNKRQFSEDGLIAEIQEEIKEQRIPSTRIVISNILF